VTFVIYDDVEAEYQYLLKDANRSVPITNFLSVEEYVSTFGFL